MRCCSLPALVLTQVLALLLASAASAQAAGTAVPVTQPVQTAALVEAPLPVTPDNSGSATPMGFVIAAPSQPRTPRLHLFDWTLLGAAATLRVLDYTSTEKGLADPAHFHEAILPTALVENKLAFAAFEAGTVAVNYGAYRLLVRHNMRSLARMGQYLYVGIMTAQVAKNYQFLGEVPAH